MANSSIPRRVSQAAADLASNSSSKTKKHEASEILLDWREQTGK